MKRIGAALLGAVLVAGPVSAQAPLSPATQLKQHFTPAQIQRIQGYRQRFQAIKTQQDFAGVYREAIALSEALAPALEKLYAHYESSGQLQDSQEAFMGDKAFQWLNGYLPGLRIFLVAEGTQAALFPVYPPFSQQARKTTGKADDRFVTLLVKAFGESEHIMFPAWFYQTWDYGGCSLLGSGKHLEVLQLGQQNLKESQLFKAETVQIKQLVLEDILQRNQYCQSQPEILAEMAKILSSGTLSSQERQALETRTKAFSQPPKGLELGCNQGKDCTYG